MFFLTSFTRLEFETTKTDSFFSIDYFGRNFLLPTVKASVAGVIQLENDAVSMKMVLTEVDIWGYPDLHNNLLTWIINNQMR